MKAVPVSDCKPARKAVDKLCADVEVQAGQKPYWFKMDETGAIAGGIAKFINANPETAQAVTEALGLKPNTLVFLSAGKLTDAQKTAGVMRRMLGTACEGHMDKARYEFCWIVDFPMYETGEESGELEFCHNLLSMPTGGMETLLKAERGEISLLDIMADQYDLVCNGVELSSGAVRNHDPEIMVKAFEMVAPRRGRREGEVPGCVQRVLLRRAAARGHRPGRGPHGHAAFGRGVDPRGHRVPDEQERAGRDDGRAVHGFKAQLDELHIALVPEEE